MGEVDLVPGRVDRIDGAGALRMAVSGMRHPHLCGSGGRARPDLTFAGERDARPVLGSITIGP